MAYVVRHQVYCHLVVATMSIVMFGGMCRYDDATCLLRLNIRFESDRNGFEILFDTRKDAKFRQGNKVSVASSPLAAVCHVRLLRELRFSTGGAVDLHVVCRFNGRLVAKCPRATAPVSKKTMYDYFLRFLSLWFS